MHKRFGRVSLFLDPGAAGGGQSDGQDPQRQINELLQKIEQLQSPGYLQTVIEQAIEKGVVFPKDRFVGMQSTMQTALNEKTAKEQELAQIKAQFDELQGQVSEKDTSLETYKTQIETIQNELGATKNTLDAVKKRNAIIFGEFPHLAPFEAKELLPNDSDENALRQKLKDFSATIGGIGERLITNFASGSTTPPPAADPSKDQTADALLKQANLAFKEHRMEDYQKYYAQYLAALPKDQ